MITQNASIIPSFVSQAQFLVSIMHHRLSGNSNKKIVINRSLSIQKPLVIPIEEADDHCITLEDFLVILDVRINAEFTYYEEITRLKTNLSNEFNKLCDGSADEDFIKFVHNQKQIIINTIIDETKIENKMIAEHFYNEIMNGWDENALDLKKFSKIAYAVLWKPLLTPFPIGALDKLAELIGELGNKRASSKIKRVTYQFVEYMKEYLKVKDIKDSDYDSSEKLAAILEKLIEERRICNVEIKDLSKIGSIGQELATECVEEVRVETTMDKLLKNKLKLNYDKLTINGLTKAANSSEIIDKVQKKITELKWTIGNDNIGDDGAHVVSIVFQKLVNLSILNLNFWYTSIGDKGAKAISAALMNLKNISTLNLNFLHNNIGDDGVKAISAAMIELKDISTLTLIFGKNKFGVEGAKALSAALTKLTNVLTLILSLDGNNVGNEGAKAVSVGLKDLKNISNLTLILRSNNIEDEGAIAVAVTLEKLKSISAGSLNLLDNEIGNSGKAALNKLKMINSKYEVYY